MSEELGSSGWRSGGEPEALKSGRHRLTREQVLASQRGRIMRAVLLELGEFGAGGVTVSGVVERAKVSKKTFYENFEGLEACIDAALYDVNILVGSEIADATDAADRSRSFPKVRAMIAELAAAAAEEPEHGTAIVASGFGQNDPKAKTWLMFNNARFRILAAYFADGFNEHPEVPKPDETTVMAAVGLIELWLKRGFASGSHADLPDQADGISDKVIEILSGGRVKPD